jgi:hypothetical protein
MPTEIQSSVSSHRMMPSTSESFLNSNAKQAFEIGSTDQPESLLLSFGSKLDGLCGGVHVRQLAVLYGEKVCQTIAQQLCVRAQLPIKAGGLNARSVFIDGGNTFDPHYRIQLRGYTSSKPRQNSPRDHYLTRIHMLPLSSYQKTLLNTSIT